MGIRLGWFTKSQNCTENEGGVDVLAWIKTVDLQSQCHWKLGEQQFNSVCTLIHIYVDLSTLCSKHKTFIRCWVNVGSTSATLDHWCKLSRRLCLLRVSSLNDVWYTCIWATLHYFWLTCNFHLNERDQSYQFVGSLFSVCLTGLPPLFWICVMRAPG